MNDYNMGALEALCWVLKVLKNKKSSEAGKQRIRDAIASLIKTAVETFEYKIRE